MKTKSLWIIVIVCLFGILLIGYAVFLLTMGNADQFWYVLILCLGFAGITTQAVIGWRRRKWVRWKNKRGNDDDDYLWPHDDGDDKYWRRR